MGKLSLYLKMFRQAGLRITDQRRTICAYLAATTTHPTPYQVFADIAQAHPEISRATVYNTLNTLQQLGAIVELSFGADHTHYDTNPLPHVNLICLRCHKIEDYDGVSALSEEHLQLHDHAGFQTLAIRVDVLGVCADCQAKQATDAQSILLPDHHSQQSQDAPAIFHHHESGEPL